MPRDTKLCGSNGRVYNDECDMRKESCKLQTAIEPADMSVCDSSLDKGEGNQKVHGKF